MQPMDDAEQLRRQVMQRLRYGLNVVALERDARYADDTLLGFVGPKDEAEQIKSRIAAFLRDDLKLELPQEKTLITHARTQAAKFLGYEITVDHNDRKVTRGRDSANGVVGLRVPSAVIKAQSNIKIHTVAAGQSGSSWSIRDYWSHRRSVVPAGQPVSEWARVSEAFAALRDATGPTAPPAVQAILGGHSGGGPVPDAPEEMNPTMRHAAACNEDPSRLDFSAAWAAYQKRVADHPVAGLRQLFPPECVGWPFPAQVAPMRPTAGSLVLSGHRYESITPYEWATRMRTSIGGTVSPWRTTNTGRS